MSNYIHHTHLNDERIPLLQPVPQVPLNDDEVAHLIQPEEHYPRRYRSHHQLIIAGSVILILIIISIVVYYVFDDLLECLSNSIELQVNDISFNNLTPQGMDLKIDSNVDIHYRFKNSIQSVVIGSLTSIIGTLTIVNLKPIEIYSKFIDLDSDFIYLGNSLPPPMNVTIKDDAENELKFITECNFQQSEVVKFLKYYYQIDSSEVNLKVRGIAEKVQIKYGVLKFSIENIKFTQDAMLNKGFIEPKIEIEKFKINSTSENINVDTKLSIRTDSIELPKLEVESIDWNLLFEDCSSKLVTVGEWRSSPIRIQKSDSIIDLSVKGSIKSIPSSLMNDCGDNLSPINKIVQRYLHGQPICFYLQLKKTTSKLPPWIVDFLHTKAIQMFITLPSLDVPISPTGLCVDSSDIYIDDNIKLDSNFTLVKNETMIDFENVKFKTKFELIANGVPILRGDANDFVIENNNNLLASFLDNLQIDLLKPQIVGELMNNMLNKGADDIDLQSNIILQDVIVNTPIFKDVKFKELTYFNLSLPNNMSNFNYQEILDRMNVTIDNLYLIESSNDKVRFLIDLSLTNPTTISIDMMKEIIKFGIYRNRLKLLDLALTRVYIPNSEEFQVSCEAYIDLKTYEERIGLETFISSYISTGAKNLTIDIENNRLPTNPKLDELMNQISINDVQLPGLNFQISDIDEGNPFIVEVVIHVFTSEIEIKVYNPVRNSEIVVEIFSAQAKHEDTVLGYLAKREIVIIPPGVFQTQRIPIKINSKDSMDILKKYLNNELDIKIMAIMNLQLDQFDVSVLYKGNQLSSKIRF